MKLIAKSWLESGFRTYHVSRVFNVLLSCDDWQGDGKITFTIILFFKALQLNIWFNHDKHKWVPLFDWRIFHQGRL